MDSLISVSLITAISLLLWPEARDIMFPPAPPALVNYHTGGLSKPQSGMLGSLDSATGAPENFKGEAVENEANNFVTGIMAISTNILTDEDPQHSEDQRGSERTNSLNLPRPNDLAIKVATAKDKASGVDRPSEDKTKAPMEKFMWGGMKPLMHTVCTISDIWERGAK